MKFKHRGNGKIYQLVDYVDGKFADKWIKGVIYMSAIGKTYWTTLERWNERFYTVEDEG